MQVAIDFETDPQTQVYIVRGTDLVWYVKRIIDGKVICNDADKSNAVTKAKILGYHFAY